MVTVEEGRDMFLTCKTQQSPSLTSRRRYLKSSRSKIPDHNRPKNIGAVSLYKKFVERKAAE